MKAIIAWIAAAVAFGGLDAVWLNLAAPRLYRPALGDLLAPQFRPGPALVFYALYLGAIVWFAVRPGWSGGVGAAALNGALLGLVSYATYDLTNQATLRAWPLHVTLVDLAWGTFATMVASIVATLVSAGRG